MTLSIIIPTYNSGTVLNRALDSILSQAFTDWEVLVMDGASTDDTVSIAESYGNSRIHVFSEPDKGIYDAMNKGIKKAQGEWLYFLGSDDWLLDGVLQDVFTRDIEKYDIIYGDVDSTYILPIGLGEWNNNILQHNRCHQGIFHRKKVFEICGLYDMKYKISADHDMNLRWFLNPRIKDMYIPLTIAHFSDTGVSCTSRDNLFWHDYDSLLLKYGFFRLPPQIVLRCIKHIVVPKIKEIIIHGFHHSPRS